MRNQPQHEGAPGLAFETWDSATTCFGSRTTISAVCATGHAQNQPHFTGKERDPESQNDYFGARYYASSMGRFMSPDSLGYQVATDPQSLNLSAYVRNNPLTRVDVDGHDCTGMEIEACDPEAEDKWMTMPQGARDRDRHGEPEPWRPPEGWWRGPYCNGVQCEMNGMALWYLLQGLAKRNFGVGFAPNNAVVSFAKHWWKDVKSCVGGVGIPAIENALNPFSLGVGTAANVASDMSQASLAGAASWSVSQGLTVPLRSSIVRAGAGSAETLGKASGVLTLGSVVYALGAGVVAEWNGCL
jgi:RHS repeat-associated protein